MRLPVIAVCAVAVLGVAPAARATIIATIDGGYDASCGSDSACNTAVIGGASFLSNDAYAQANPNGAPQNGDNYDTPSLFIINSTAFSFTGITLTGVGYQGTNNGDTTVETLPDIGPNTVYQYVFKDNDPGFAPCGESNPTDVFNYDYDDAYGCSTADQPGNAQITFSATLSGGPDAGPIFAVFSPTTNFTGGFVGFEGLDQTGNAESSFDDHNGTPQGILQVIQTGTAPVPEPSTLALIGSALAGFGLVRRRRKAPPPIVHVN